MSTLLTLLLPALAPALTDGFRALVNRAVNGKGKAVEAPERPDTSIAYISAETARIDAMARLDAVVGTPSQWVVDLRASFRYIAVLVIWCLTAGAIYTQQDMAVIITLLEICGATLSFIIGERFYLKIKNR